MVVLLSMVVCISLHDMRRGITSILPPMPFCSFLSIKHFMLSGASVITRGVNVMSTSLLQTQQSLVLCPGISTMVSRDAGDKQPGL